MKWYLLMLLIITPTIAFSQHKFSSLEQLWLYADSSSLAASTGSLQVQAAETDRLLVRSSLFPRVNAYSTADYNLIIPSMVVPDLLFGGPAGKSIAVQFGMPLTTNIGAEISMPLIDFGKWSQLRSSAIKMDAATAGKKALIEELKIQLAQLYYQYLFTNELLNINGSNQATVAELVKMMQKRYDEGVLNPADLNRTKKLELDQQMLGIAYKQNLELISAMLKRALNISQERSIELTPVLSTTSPGLPLQQGEVQSSRWVLQQQQKLSAVALNEVTTARKSQLPRLSLVSRYYHQWQMDPGKPQTVDFDAAIVGLRIDVPIAAGRQLQHQRERSELEYKLQLQREKDVAANVAQQEREWLTRYQAALLKQHVLQQRVNLAQENLKIATLSITEGVMEFDEYNNIFLEYNQAKLDHLQNIADAELYKLLLSKKW